MVQSLRRGGGGAAGHRRATWNHLWAGLCPQHPIDTCICISAYLYIHVRVLRFTVQGLEVRGLGFGFRGLGSVSDVVRPKDLTPHPGLASRVGGQGRGCLLQVDQPRVYGLAEGIGS